MKSIKLKVVNAVLGHKVGQVLDVDTDTDGTPLDFYMRRYLKDGSLQKEAPKPKPARKPKTTRKEEE